MWPRGHGQGRRRHRGGAGAGGAADEDFVGTGFALVLSTVSYLLLFVVVVGGGQGQPPSITGVEWQVILALGAMAAGLLMIMYGMRARGRGARPPVLVRRVAGAAGALLWHAGGP